MSTTDPAWEATARAAAFCIDNREQFLSMESAIFHGRLPAQMQTGLAECLAAMEDEAIRLLGEAQPHRGLIHVAAWLPSARISRWLLKEAPRAFRSATRSLLRLKGSDHELILRANTIAAGKMDYPAEQLLLFAEAGFTKLPFLSGAHILARALALPVGPESSKLLALAVGSARHKAMYDGEGRSADIGEEHPLLSVLATDGIWLPSRIHPDHVAWIINELDAISLRRPPAERHSLANRVWKKWGNGNDPQWKATAILACFADFGGTPVMANGARPPSHRDMIRSRAAVEALEPRSTHQKLQRMDKAYIADMLATPSTGEFLGLTAYAAQFPDHYAGTA